VKNALVVGAGSIGLRHAIVLKSLGLSVAQVTQRTDFDGKVFRTIAQAMNEIDFDYVVIANETNKHESALEQLVGFSGIILVEKPFSVSAATLSKFQQDQVFVAFNLRFHPVLLWLKEQLRGQKVLSVECYVGQHLASWRPGRAVEDQYSALAASGGGVLRDLSHELDYLTWLFGDWSRVAALGGRIGTITVDSDDSWSLISEFKDVRQVSVQLNYFDKKTRRQVIVNTDSDTYSVDLVNFKATIGGADLDIAGATADTYVSMHEAVMSGNTASLCSSIAGRKVDLFIDAIESASTQKVWVSR
jgi:predicted dehydrogenase